MGGTFQRESRSRPRKRTLKNIKFKRLNNLASKPLLDLLPRNLEVHNQEIIKKLSRRKLELLGLGLQFIPTQKVPRQ